MGKIILTGDRPTGRLHLGHYVGSLRRRVELQESGEFERIFIMIADAQALTDNADNPEKVRQNIIEVALDYLSVGLDPKRSTLFIQSQIPELCELSFYYMNLVTVQRLQRNPTVKAEIQLRGFAEGAAEGDTQQKQGIPVGFFTYPISQAADITAFKATTVPAGEDQEPMIEQTREIVHKFNTVYGPALVEPEILLPENAVCMRLPGTDPGKVEGNTVFTYLDAFSRPEHFPKYLPDYPSLDELKAHYRRGGLGDVKVKKFLIAVLNETLEPFRERRKYYEGRIEEVYEILRTGSEAARQMASQTLDDVKRAMKINYFDDKRLIAEQAEHFARKQ